MSKTTDRGKSFADHGYTKVFNMVDIYSGYTWQMAAKKRGGGGGGAILSFEAA
eukprot:COSAG01_NODE_973_length_12368_cov_12.435732_5_plen_53_part_00